MNSMMGWMLLIVILNVAALYMKIISGCDKEFIYLIYFIYRTPPLLCNKYQYCFAPLWVCNCTFQYRQKRPRIAWLFKPPNLMACENNALLHIEYNLSPLRLHWKYKISMWSCIIQRILIRRWHSKSPCLNENTRFNCDNWISKRVITI